MTIRRGLELKLALEQQQQQGGDGDVHHHILPGAVTNDSGCSSTEKRDDGKLFKAIFDAPLTEKGKRQATALQARFASLGVPHHQQVRSISIEAIKIAAFPESCSLVCVGGPPHLANLEANGSQ